MIKSMLIAAGFSMFYASMYPILIGGFVIYVYPYWSRGAALVWVLCGILLQAWFCFRQARKAPGWSALMQVGAGLLYGASIMMLSGGCYQS
jgi:hypothetical protein